MRIELAYLSSRRSRLKSTPAAALVADFCQRASRYCSTVTTAFSSEAELLASLERGATRVPVYFALLDSRGDLLTSEDFAARLGAFRDGAGQHLVLAIGPPDGWSPAALARARLRLSFGRMTLSHELALVVLAEQVYRALTILAGHPYHDGHTRSAEQELRVPK